MTAQLAMQKAQRKAGEAKLLARAEASLSQPLVGTESLELSLLTEPQTFHETHRGFASRLCAQQNGAICQGR
jgi:hypothetical protein